ncbi:MAG TPA: hypothetical protein V6D19_13210, partial [Stenomitos sp.]
GIDESAQRLAGGFTLKQQIQSKLQHQIRSGGRHYLCTFSRYSRNSSNQQRVIEKTKIEIARFD